jgi:hypothetical protein
MPSVASLERQKQPARVDDRKHAITLPVRARFPATLFRKNFNSAVKAAPVLPHNDFGLFPCPSHSAPTASTNSKPLRRSRTNASQESKAV